MEHSQLVEDLWEQCVLNCGHLKEFDGVPVDNLREMLKILEKNEKYESCVILKAYIDSRVREDKLKELLGQ